MSTHEGVSCDTCMKNNFPGRRYKCLICYDFDLCSTCHEAGASNNQHLNTHPMQCILTRADYELYYGGETNIEPQSFTCPYCGKLGYSEATLSDHVTIDHEDDAHEVVCPICAAIPTGDPNHLTEDLLNHINTEHRNNRDSSSNDDSTNRFSRRLGSRSNTGRRGGRNTFQFGSTGAAAAASLVGRDGMDPIAELLSQLSGVRRAVAQTSTLQLQQLQAHLREREKEHLQQTRQTTNIFGSQPKPAGAKVPATQQQLTATSSTTPTTSSNTTSSILSTQNLNTNNNSNLQTNPLFNQILELPNVFESSSTSRDNRFLLSRYENNSSSSTLNSKSSTNNQINKEQQNNPSSINQSFFIHDILLSTLLNQIDDGTEFQEFSDANRENIDIDLTKKST